MNAVEEVRQVLDAYWSMALEGQAPSADWPYRKVRAAVTSPTEEEE